MSLLQGRLSPHQIRGGGLWLLMIWMTGLLLHLPLSAGAERATSKPETTLEVLALAPAPASLHPFLLSASANGVQLSPFLVERLGQINDTQNTLELPLLEPPAPGLSQSRHLLRLKPGWKFSNGQPLTARDLESSYQRLKRAASAPQVPPPVQALARCFFLLEDLRARDNFQLELTFRRPVRSEELAPMLASLPIFPTEATDDALHRGTAPTLGPYQVVQTQPDTLSLRANAFYPFGLPSISSVTFHYLTSEALALKFSESATAQSAARIFVLPPALAGSAQGRTDLQLRVAESHRVLVLGFNQHASSRLAQKPTLRRAIAHLIDVQGLLEGLPMPDWLRSPLTGPYAQDRRYEGLLKPLPQLKFDPVQARIELGTLGYERSGETMRDTKGEPLALTLAVDPRVPSGQDLAGLIREQLEREGLTVNGLVTHSGQPTSEGTTPDLLLQEWYMDEDEGYTELLHSKGVFNPLSLNDAALDKLLTLERSAMLLASRERYRREIQTRLVETAAAVWLWQRRDVVAIQMAPGSTLRTTSALDPYYLFRSVHHWRLESEAPLGPSSDIPQPSLRRGEAIP